jgi:Raf kinase inhibitor-like YbhB/YbcL family protein
VPEERRGTAVLCSVGLLALVLVSCKDGENDMARTTTPTERAQVQVTSPAFKEGGMIPQQYTCEGEDISPPLRWGAVPEGTESLAVIMEDPDAPWGTFVHWVVYDLPPELQGLPENLPRDKTFAVGGVQGVNNSSELGYKGPCPPSGTHRYFFRLYALDAKTDLPAGETKNRLLKAMEGHILAQGQLMGKYKRQ